MSPYEYMDLSQGSAANALSMLAFGFSILCAYLFVAYTIGEKLKQSQVIAITAIYAFTYVFNMILQMRAVSVTVDFARMAGQVSPEIAPALSYGAILTVLAIRASVFLVSLWFMWDVRRQKPD
jgi:hypothetical protein